MISWSTPAGIWIWTPFCFLYHSNAQWGHHYWLEHLHCPLSLVLKKALVSLIHHLLIRFSGWGFWTNNFVLKIYWIVIECLTFTGNTHHIKKVPELTEEMDTPWWMTDMMVNVNSGLIFTLTEIQSNPLDSDNTMVCVVIEFVMSYFILTSGI